MQQKNNALLELENKYDMSGCSNLDIDSLLDLDSGHFLSFSTLNFFLNGGNIDFFFFFFFFF